MWYVVDMSWDRHHVSELGRDGGGCER